MDAVEQARDAHDNKMIYSNPEWRRILKGVLDATPAPVESSCKALAWGMICAASSVLWFVVGILVRGWW